MRKRSFRQCALAAAAAVFLAGCVVPKGKDTVFQTATISSLMAGGYDGGLACRDLRKYGDLGIGTFNALDGEMIALDGQFYQVKGDGQVCAAGGALKTPFAVVTWFEADLTLAADKALGLKELESFMDSRLPSKNMLYAIRIDGTFDFVKTRSVRRQQRPYPKLVDAVKDQQVFRFTGTKGTIVGFRFPAYVQGVNVPGYHLHFITADRTGGGHLLDVRTKDVTIKIDTSADWYISLPEEGDFRKVVLVGEMNRDLEKVEKNTCKTRK